jgi:Fe2+ transport system protein FeoA
MPVRRLSELQPGQRGRVVKVGASGPVKRRVLDMGLVSGAEVEVVRVAPLGDPIEFIVKGYNLSLRKSEAQEIEVETTEST